MPQAQEDIMNLDTVDDRPIDVFDIFEQHETASERETRIGQVEYAPDGRLAIVEVSPDRRNFLEAAVNRVNGKEAIARLVPPADGGSQFTLASEVVERSSDRFLAALQEHLSKYFRLRLG
jgi:hypothetical protein